jgi:hypothetical protein
MVDGMQEHEPPASPPSDPTIFWAELAPCEHLLQIYREESGFLDTLAAFAASGLAGGEAVIVIATAAHRSSLDARLVALGVDIQAAGARRMYFALDAADVLSRFMRDDWPDEDRFAATILDVLAQVAPGCRVRAFGEMVALLWARGSNGATVRLEHLWSDFCRDHALALFCAYPRIGATRDLDESLAEVCALHTRVLT